MAIEIRVPSLGESISEATVGKWYKKVGDYIERDEAIVELETDKVTIEVPAPVSGILSDIIGNEGLDVKIGTVIGSVEQQSESSNVTKMSQSGLDVDIAHQAVSKGHSFSKISNQPTSQSPSQPVSEALVTTGKLSKKLPHRIETIPSPVTAKKISDPLVLNDNITPLKSPLLEQVATLPARDESGREKRVPMSRLRRTIAERLLHVQQNTAMLTTFNEVDMSNIMALRKTYQDAFFAKHDIKLGIMSFFVKATIQALKEFPALNAEIDKEDLILKNYYHIGVAVGTDKGLVVPVLRDADQMQFDEIEKGIVSLATKSREGHLEIKELQGGTFSLTNGGIYGSMMSTPILNMPQSGILGMHQIKERPIALDGEVVIRPMMYLALTYDHRIVDGKDAVSFLVSIKDSIETPERLLLDL